MTLPPVYLHALGMINALGDDTAAIASALAASQSPGMGPMSMKNGDAFVGRVLAPLDIAPPAALERFDCRNNRLLLAALAVKAMDKETTEHAGDENHDALSGFSGAAPRE